MSSDMRSVPSLKIHRRGVTMQFVCVAEASGVTASRCDPEVIRKTTVTRSD